MRCHLMNGFSSSLLAVVMVFLCIAALVYAIGRALYKESVAKAPLSRAPRIRGDQEAFRIAQEFLREGRKGQACSYFWQAHVLGHKEAFAIYQDLRRELNRQVHRAPPAHSRSRPAPRPVPSCPHPSGSTTERREKGRPRPMVNDIWYAEIPFEETAGSKDRPCLIDTVSEYHVTVYKITSTQRDGWPHVKLPRSDKYSWVAIDRPIVISKSALRRRISRLEP
ncbi:type II toxin-antitoxin system PemK/MazF family toxin [Streptosporangium sp. NPDC050855]|uniref:type II toxin-antitoxin system PemK/MazF family toxin n=1 Tax=Streptosporangium sp. NPDC050855 TaxID=3366194 RepID=UPI0037BA0FB5